MQCNALNQPKFKHPALKIETYGSRTPRRHLFVVAGAVDGVEGLVDLVVVPLDGGDSALGNLLQSANLLVGGFGRRAAAVAGRSRGADDRVGLLRGDESSRGHCNVLCRSSSDDGVVGWDDLED
jgi:hypothetical protein